MIRTCPKCGDYYADASLAFCLVDGTPLINLDTMSERWSEGARVIEEKGNALRRQKRKLKWQRILLSAMTMAIATMIVYVVAANTLIYLKPKPEEVAVATPLTQPTAEPEPVEPVGSITPSTPGETSPTLPTKSAATKTPTPTPTPVYKIRGRVTVNGKALRGVPVRLSGSQSATLMTDKNGSYAFGNLLAGGHYTITPASAKIGFEPLSHSINKLTRDESVDFIGTQRREQSGCSAAAESLDAKAILDKNRNRWERGIQGVLPKIIAENMPAGAPPGRNGVPDSKPALSKIEFEFRFMKVCKASVTASVNLIGRRVTVRRFTCTKTGDVWDCG